MYSMCADTLFKVVSQQKTHGEYCRLIDKNDNSTALTGTGTDGRFGLAGSLRTARNMKKKTQDTKKNHEPSSIIPGCDMRCTTKTLYPFTHLVCKSTCASLHRQRAHSTLKSQARRKIKKCKGTKNNKLAALPLLLDASARR